LCRTYRMGPRKVATVTRAPSAVRTRMMRTRGPGYGNFARTGIVSVAGIVIGVAEATTSRGPIFTAGLAGLVARGGVDDAG